MHSSKMRPILQEVIGTISLSEKYFHEHHLSHAHQIRCLPLTLPRRRIAPSPPFEELIVTAMIPIMQAVADPWKLI